MRGGGRARRAARITVLALAMPLAAACAGTANPSTTASSNGVLSGTIGGNAVALLKTLRTSSAGTVVSSGTGYTLYWFSRDTARSSACDTLCIAQWPPVTGVPRAASGVTLPGRLGTVTRSGGVVQATYDGHPLYTFAGDFDPGDVGGNGVVQFGGTWHAVRPGLSEQS
jgi:predicted lipoprotein with Yx(FWY)xxD motif